MKHKTRIRDTYLDYPYIGILAEENSESDPEEERIING